MAVVAGDILTSLKAALLNDPTGAIYPDARMYPVMHIAYKRLQLKLSAIGMKPNKEIFDPVTVTAGTVRLGDGAGLPLLLLRPLTIKERRSGSTDRYSDMDEVDFEPDITIGTTLQYWAWREEEIKFPGSTADRQILIYGEKSLGSITDTNSPILLIESEAWLAQKTAAIAALTIGQNPKRADSLEEGLADIWEDMRSAMTRREQSKPVRRRRTRFRVL